MPFLYKINYYNMAQFPNVQITRIQDNRFYFDDKWVTPRSKEREESRLQRQPPVPSKKPLALTEAEAEAWAAELTALQARGRETDVKMTEEYNRWHTLDDQLDCGALLRGIHNIQERGGSVADEKRFCNTITDRFGHKRLEFNDETVEEKRLFGCQFPHQCGHRDRSCENWCPNQQN